jgi:hypothetical protein
MPKTCHTPQGAAANNTIRTKNVEREADCRWQENAECGSPGFIRGLRRYRIRTSGSSSLPFVHGVAGVPAGYILPSSSATVAIFSGRPGRSVGASWVTAKKASLAPDNVRNSSPI